MTDIFVDEKATGLEIDRLMKRRGVSVRDVYDMLGTLSSVRVIYRWMNGETLPSLDNLVKLSRILGVSLDDLVMVKEMEFGRQNDLPSHLFPGKQAAA